MGDPRDDALERLIIDHNSSVAEQHAIARAAEPVDQWRDPNTLSYLQTIIIDFQEANNLVLTAIQNEQRAKSEDDTGG